MRKILSARLEEGRIREGRLGSDSSCGAVGAFVVFGPCGEELRIIASEGGRSVAKGWEHVSVSTRRRTPNWREMSFVKDLFWDDEECVVQFHPPRSEYVNNHPHVLHLWRHVDGHALPPSILVGYKDRGVLSADEAAEILANHGQK
jgi:hypothetical protein